MAQNFELVVSDQFFSVVLGAYKWFKIQRHLPSCGVNVTSESGISIISLTLANGAIQKHLNKTFKAAAIMLPSQILNIGRVSF